MGTNSLDTKLHISESNSSTSDTSGLKITNENLTTNTNAGILFQNYDNNGAWIRSIRTGSSNGKLSFGTNSGAGVAESNISERMVIDHNGNVGIGVTPSSAKLEVNGHFAATSKSFIIDHPTKENKKLQYASLEGPENGVYVRGTTDKETIELPEYWSELVHEDSITVVLTPIGKKQDLFIKEKSNKLIKIGGVEGSFDYVIYGERKDIKQLEIEPSKI